MKDVISQVHEWIKLISQVGIGLIALRLIVEIVFGKCTIVGAIIVQKLSQIVAEIGSKKGFVGLVAILIILAILKETNNKLPEFIKLLR